MTINEPIPYGYCHCGCGQKTKISKDNHTRYKRVKGEPLKFLRYHHVKLFKKDDCDKITYPVNKDGIRKHIVVAEKALGTKIPHKACVHHVDSDFRNYENSNLVICQDDAYHRLLHVRTEALKQSGNANYKKCMFCKAWDDPEKMTNPGSGPSYYHKPCNAKYYRDRRIQKKINDPNGALRKNNTSGCVGVCFNKISKKWSASISTNNNKINLGTFKTIDEAICARKTYENKHTVKHYPKQ